MSKTSNYQLTLWDREDEERLGEINENFGKLDTVLGGLIVTGTYTGSSKSLSITLGFQPRAVLVMLHDGVCSASSYTRGGLALPGHPVVNEGTECVKVTDTGFYVVNTGYSLMCLADRIYHYVAVA